MSGPFKVTAFDHVVVNVADVERSLRFYCDELGLEPLRVDEWRRKEVFFPSVRVDATTIIDLLEVPRSGENVNHFCLVVEPADLLEVCRYLHNSPSLKFEILNCMSGVDYLEPDPKKAPKAGYEPSHTRNSTHLRACRLGPEFRHKARV